MNFQAPIDMFNNKAFIVIFLFILFSLFSMINSMPLTSQEVTAEKNKIGNITIYNPLTKFAFCITAKMLNVFSIEKVESFSTGDNGYILKFSYTLEGESKLKLKTVFVNSHGNNIQTY